MNILKNLFGGGSGERGDSDSNALWLYVQCGKCGAPLAVRVDRRNEVSQDYEKGGLWLRKEMMDSTCFQLMYAELQFSANGEIIERSIDRGKFLDKVEYDTLKADWDTRKRHKN